MCAFKIVMQRCCALCRPPHRTRLAASTRPQARSRHLQSEALSPRRALLATACHVARCLLSCHPATALPVLLWRQNLPTSLWRCLFCQGLDQHTEARRARTARCNPAAEVAKPAVQVFSSSGSSSSSSSSSSSRISSQAGGRSESERQRRMHSCSRPRTQQGRMTRWRR